MFANGEGIAFQKMLFILCFGGSLIRCFNMREKRERVKKK